MTRVLPGLYTRTDQPADLRAVSLAAQRLVGGGAVVCDETSAELFGMRLPERMTRAGGAPIHLCTAGGPSPRSTAQLVVRRRDRPRTIRLHGVEMSHPVVALQEIASRLSRDELVVAVDSLVADRFGTVYRIPLSEVADQVAAATGRGADALRGATALARERVWSPRETRMRLMLSDRGWASPDLNHGVIDPATGIVYYVDLAYPSRRIAIEYDGTEHLTDPDRIKLDHRKTTVLHAEGWTVIRAYAEDLHDPTDFFARLDAAWGAEPVPPCGAVDPLSQRGSPSGSAPVVQSPTAPASSLLLHGTDH
jgi:hypothetical protein